MTAELKFIKRARDFALKEGALNSIAVASASRIGEGPPLRTSGIFADNLMERRFA
jgi:hypothetical protein